MYPRSKFQEILLDIREEMAREADFDVDLFVEMVRSGARRDATRRHSLADAGRELPAERRRPRTGRK